MAMALYGATPDTASSMYLFLQLAFILRMLWLCDLADATEPLKLMSSSTDLEPLNNVRIPHDLQ